MKKHIVAGNWKMNKTAAETKALIEELHEQDLDPNVEVLIAPTSVHLAQAVQATAGSRVAVAAQNMHQAQSGAFTGEISASMLIGVGVEHVILGHSERRAYFGENDALLAEKVQAALDSDLQVIFCFGEELSDRQKNTHFDVVESQLRNALFDLPSSAWSSIVLAYEPVWAIGTGVTASSDQAQEMHKVLRDHLASKFGQEAADNCSLLYGGSCKPDNAQEIFAQPDVDGGLIGGASLKAEDFIAIAKSF
mgnify:CR=1 FL=1